MPSSHSNAGDLTAANNLQTVITLFRENASRTRTLCAICVFLIIILLGLQTAAVVIAHAHLHQVASFIVRYAIAVGVLAIVANHWQYQNRLLASAERTIESVREDEERNRIAGLTVAEGIVSAGADGKIIYFNLTAEQIFGRKSADVFGQPLTILMPARFHESHISGFQRYLDTGVSNVVGNSVEVVGVRADGEEFPVEVAITHVHEGRHNFFTAVVRDISDKKRAEEKLRKSEQQYRLMVQNVRDYAILTLDRNGLITSWNEGAQRIKGYTADEIVGEHFSRFYSKDDIEAGKPEIELEVTTAEGRFEEEGWRVRKDGTRFWANVVLTALKDEHGSLYGFVKVTRDISERKQIETEIRKLNDDLKRRNDELDASNQELEAFTYSVAHDLRAPLRHISGFAKILTEEYGPGMETGAREYLDDIRRGAERMGTLIDDLLSLTRLARQEVRLQITGLSNIVGDVLRMLQTEAEGRNIEWKIADLPFVECDPGLMVQVYMNLLSNAVKYTRPRDPAVIEVGRTELDGETVLFVRDNGVGFNMKYADKLFGVFQRLHRAEDFEGTGVGLATVQRIIQKHGGRIWAESELDRGTTFYFTLSPRTESAEEPTSAR